MADKLSVHSWRDALKKYLYLLILLFVSLAGCTSFVTEPVVTVKDLNVVAMDSAGATMELHLGVKNPNPYEVKLQGYNYDLKVMTLPLARGGAREELRFSSRSETDVRIPIRVSFGDLVEILKRRPDPDAIPYQLAAGLDLDTPMGQMTVPVNKKGTYAVPKEYRPSALLNKITDFFR